MHSVALNQLYSHRELLWAWTIRTIRARYKQSVLGGIWAILQPAATVAIFTVVFTFFIPVDTGDIPYAVFAYSAMVPWVFFTTSVTDMVDSLVNNMNLVSKIYFPREILPIAAMLARLLDFAIAGAVLFVLFIYYGIPLFQGSWIWLPSILAVQLIMITGIGLLGSALNVFYRDIRHIFSLGLQIWLYATPIVYPVSVVPESIRPFYFLNPMAGVIEAYRAVLLYGEPLGGYFIISAVMAFVIFIIGYWFFKRVEFRFADLV